MVLPAVVEVTMQQRKKGKAIPAVEIMYDKDGFPLVNCVRVGSQLVVLKCPFCGCQHFHGPPAGHRVAHHCYPKELEPPSGYVLRLVEPF